MKEASRPRRQRAAARGERSSRHGRGRGGGGSLVER